MRRRATAVAVLAVLLLASLLPGISMVMAQDGATPGVLRVNWGDPIPDTLDPQLSHWGQWGISGGVDYEGLTRLDEELMPVPGAAESWQFSEDGKTLTFHLRDGLVFSDGVRIFAEHFVYGAQRLCSPELDSASASLLFDVVGCEELYTNVDGATGTAAKANLGVRALNERTVEYRFDRPAPYFLVSAARWAAIPLREELIAAGGPEWWTNPATRIGNGPFRLVAYERDEPDQRLVYARNDRYWDGPTALDRLEFYFDDLQDYSATMAAYGSDKYDITWFDDRYLTELEADPVLSREVVTIPVAGTLYYSFNHTREPFTDPKVREAFAYSFDREAYNRQIEYGIPETNLGWVSPGAPGYIETDAFAFDPTKARAALAASSYGGPENLPEITWYNTVDAPVRAQRGAWLSAQFEAVLGVAFVQVTVSDEEY